MFQFAHHGIVYWPVELPWFGADGQAEPRTVHIGYRVFDRAELRTVQIRKADLLKRIGAQRDAVASGVFKRLRQWMRRLLRRPADVMRAIEQDEAADLAAVLDRVAGWRGIVDDDGEPIEFSTERLRALIAFDFYYEPIRNGLLHASRGAVTKNSLPGPAGTQGQAQV